MDVATRVASELGLPAKGVAAVVSLLSDKNTVPFIARYRKEATGGLDEVQIRAIEERRGYLIDLEDRRASVLSSIKEQGKLTPELEKQIAACATKAALEDLYLPFKKKRRTRATKARERGLEPLADKILAQDSGGSPLTDAVAFVDPENEVVDADAALAGARDIVAEVIAERADVRAESRRMFADHGMLVSGTARGVGSERTKFEQYYEFSEPVKSIPSHRFLAIRRGEREDVLRAHIDIDVERLLAWIERAASLSRNSPWAAQLSEAIADGYKRLLAPSVETDVRVELKLRSEKAAVDVFGENLRNLLLAAPLGARSVIGIDPGLRTGCKCVAVEATGRFIENTTIYLVRGDTSAAQRTFAAFVRKHQPVAIAVGNGTGGRETEAFVRKLLADESVTGSFVVQVNEAGASVYSASDVAREEFPDIDLTVRGAISIARRLQDPLAELVKIEPKAIGVGQYQHDVHELLLQQSLGGVVESCVNHVGVELNTASAPLLSYVAGIGASLAKKIVAHREANGAFRERKQVLKVAGVGPRAYEQAAGFLRIRGGSHPLDASAVHPERYALVERMAADLGVDLAALVGNAELAKAIDISKYVGTDVGEPTLRDIVAELAKPGRDPRKEFEPPKFRDDVNELADLQEGMKLEGVVTNVTAFGAFVDVGVHQDGLVHISQLSDKFVKEPSDVVKVGDKLSVRVMSVDLERKRIALSAKSDGGGQQSQKRAPARQAPQQKQKSQKSQKSRKQAPAQQQSKFSNNPFAALGKRPK